MALKSPSLPGPLRPLEIFRRFAVDTLLTAGTYAVLVGATLVLRYLATFLKYSSFHYHALEALEGAIFVSGTVVSGVILLYVTVSTTNELIHSLTYALRGTTTKSRTAGRSLLAMLSSTRLWGTKKRYHRRATQALQVPSDSGASSDVSASVSNVEANVVHELHE